MCRQLIVPYSSPGYRPAQPGGTTVLLEKRQEMASLTRNLAIVNGDTNSIIYFFFSVALRPNAGHGLLIHEVF